MAKILITGGNGLIRDAIPEFLLQEGHEPGS